MNQVYIAFQRHLLLLLFLLILQPLFVIGQSPIATIATSGSTAAMVSYPSHRGAGLRNTSGGLISSWDSTNTYTVNFNAPAAINTLSLTQFTVGSISTPIIKMPTSSIVKIRRAANTGVGDDRNYFNFWAAFSSIPAIGTSSGTFNYTAPEVLNPDDAFSSNNLTSGYDNIFQNTLASPHFGNIERIDFIIPDGIKALNDTDRIESGAIVFDRGSGDPFKIAAITAINSSNLPTAYGPLISVVAGNFGPSLLASNITYGILISDVKYYSQSRPSTNNSQNLRGVFISLRDLGLAVNQKFYGYSLFGNDVTAANPDWTTYPNNTNSDSQLDPVNILGMFKSSKSVLSVPVNFEAKKTNERVQLNFTLYNKYVSDEVIIERSSDGNNFIPIGSIITTEAKDYHFEDKAPVIGENLYRLYFKDKKGSSGYSQVKLIRFPKPEQVIVFPIPAVNTLTFILPDTWKNKNITVELWNQAGHLVQQNNYSVFTTTLKMPLGKNQNGIYLVRFINTYDQSVVVKQITILQ